MRMLHSHAYQFEDLPILIHSSIIVIIVLISSPWYEPYLNVSRLGPIFARFWHRETKNTSSDSIQGPQNIEILQILANFTWICGSCCSTCCGDIHIFLTGTDIVISDRSQYKLDLSNRSKPFKAMSIELNFEVISKDSESLLYKNVSRGQQHQ